jgi:hypothetical protein
MSNELTLFERSIAGHKCFQEIHKILNNRNKMLEIVAKDLAADNDRLLVHNIARAREAEEVDQILGKALGYPEGYPEANSVDDGWVNTGPHTIASLAAEAADAIAHLETAIEAHGYDKEEWEKKNELLEREVAWRGSFIGVVITVSYIVGGLVGFMAARAIFS